MKIKVKLEKVVENPSLLMIETEETKKVNRIVVSLDNKHSLLFFTFVTGVHHQKMAYVINEWSMLLVYLAILKYLSGENTTREILHFVSKLSIEK